MSEIKDIIESLNLPKQLIDKSEAVLKTLFGPSFEEFGGIIEDNVKFRRFKNQLKIFEKAQRILKNKNLNPQKVSLKVLAPLLEFSSYEENETLQGKWSNLTASILADDQNILFQQNCISILNKISQEEAKLLDALHDKLITKKQERYKKKLSEYEKSTKAGNGVFPANPSLYSLELFSFSMNGIVTELNINVNKFEFHISNLVSLGLLKWETDVEVSAKKADINPYHQDIDVDVNVYNNDNFIFTPLGDKFVEVCKNA